MTTIETLREELERFGEMALFSTNFDVSKSRQKLTTAEIEARDQWNEAHTVFSGRVRQQPDCATAKDFLDSSILPMKLSPIHASSRSHYQEQRHTRYYPPTLTQWTDDLENDMKKPFNNIESKLPEIENPLYSSARDVALAQNETQEEEFLRRFLWRPLSHFGLMEMRKDVDNDSSKPRTVVHGKPDELSFRFVDTYDAKVSSAVEMKSSHNLLVPNSFADLNNDARKRSSPKDRSKALPEARTGVRSDILLRSCLDI